MGEKLIPHFIHKSIELPDYSKAYRWGTGSIGIEEVLGEEELYLAYKLLLIKIEKSVIAKSHDNVSEDTIIVQQKIDGKEYSVDILNDFNGNYHGAFVRK